MPAQPDFQRLPMYHYRAILADPPWRYRTWSETRQTRSASNHYPVMSLGDLIVLPVSDIAALDCALFLWVIDSMLPQGLDLMRAWGFQYKTVAFTWVKKCPGNGHFSMGMGHWTRANPEMCLLGTRGHPRRVAKNVPQLVVSDLQEHSRKPEIVHSRISQLVPGPYLELFARRPVPGWHTWGLEAHGQDLDVRGRRSVAARADQ